MDNISIAANLQCNAVERALRSTAWGLLVATAATLLTRRLAGAFAQPLTAADFFGVALAIIVLRAIAEPARAASGRTRWQPTAAAALAMGCISLPGTPWVGLAAGWLTWILSELCQGVPATRMYGARWLHRLAQRLQGGRQTVAILRPQCSTNVAGQTLRQELQHLVDLQGHRIVNARLIEPLTYGQLNVTMHVALSPPLPGAPSVQWEQVGGPPARWSVALALPHGFRLEGKLASPAQAGDCVELEVQATS